MLGCRHVVVATELVVVGMLVVATEVVGSVLVDDVVGTVVVVVGVAVTPALKHQCAGPTIWRRRQRRWEPGCEVSSIIEHSRQYCRQLLIRNEVGGPSEHRWCRFGHRSGWSTL